MPVRTEDVVRIEGPARTGGPVTRGGVGDKGRSGRRALGWTAAVLVWAAHGGSRSAEAAPAPAGTPAVGTLAVGTPAVPSSNLAVPRSNLALPPTEDLAAAGRSVIGQPLPWFAGWTLSGEVFNRSGLLKVGPASARRGYALVFFATWCQPCEAGLRLLAAEHAALEAAGLGLVLVAVGEDAAVVEPWLKARPPVPGTVLLDRFGVVGRDLAGIGGGPEGTRASLPRTVVVDAQGTVRALLGAKGPDYMARLVGALAVTPAVTPGTAAQ